MYALIAFSGFSVVTVLTVAFRVADVPGKISLPHDIAWSLFWCHLEASFALIMASLTAFQTTVVLKAATTVNGGEGTLDHQPRDAWWRRSTPIVEDALLVAPRAAIVAPTTLVWGEEQDREKQGGMAMSVWSNSTPNTKSVKSSRSSVKSKRISQPLFEGGSSVWVASHEDIKESINEEDERSVASQA